jgi:monothiol glutaredoxin
MSLSDATHQRIASLVASDRVVLIMKGTPAQPQCGFSAKVVDVLSQLGTTYTSYDVLQDAELRDGIKAYASWPTIPQLYIDGEFVGGCDIVTEMCGSGELENLVQPAGPGDSDD